MTKGYSPEDEPLKHLTYKRQGDREARAPRGQRVPALKNAREIPPIMLAGQRPVRVQKLIF